MRLRRVVILGAFFFLIASGCLLWRSYELRRELEEAMTQAAEVRELIARLELPRDAVAVQDQCRGLVALRGQLAELEARLARTADEIAPFEFVLLPARILPGGGGDIGQGPQLLRLALSLARGGLAAIESLEPFVGAMSEGGLKGSPGAKLLELRARALPDVRAAREEIAKAERARQAINRASLSPRLSSFLVDLDEKLPKWQKMVEMADDGLILLGDLFGADGPRTLLVLGQDDAEIRATGGFIGPVWEITLDRGEIGNLRFMYSYEVDAARPVSSLPPPPEAMFKYMWAGVLTFRDANWYPDFPTSARSLKRLYEEAQGVHVDGIIALTRPQVAYLLAALGPIRIPNTGVVVDKDNVVDLLFHYAGPAPILDLGPRPRTARIWFAEQLGHALHDKVQEGVAGNQLIGVLQAVLRGLKEKHLLIYLEDEAGEALLLNHNWGGQLLSRGGDYLLTVESDMYGGELTENVGRRIEYEVAPRQGEVVSRLTLSYQSTSPKRSTACVQPGACYWNYLRVYVPRESELVARPTFPLPEGSLYYRAGHQEQLDTFTAGPYEVDKLVFGGFWVLPSGGTKTLSFEYRQPDSVMQEANGTYCYQLLVQKQAGMGAAIPLTVSVSIPEGWEVIDVEPAATRQLRGVVQFETALDADRWFKVFLRPAAGSLP